MMNPKHVLLTGASGGLGAALALQYAVPGVRLSLHGRDAQKLSETERAAVQKGATVFAKTGDVSDRAAMAEWIAECDRLESIDLVIANAGVIPPKDGGETLETDRDMFSANLIGVLNTVHPALSSMAQRKRGQIAIIASMAAFGGVLATSAYGASKTAVRIYGESLRKTFAPQGVEISVVCSGYPRSPATAARHIQLGFAVPVERAAQIIRSGLENNESCIAFPWHMYHLVRLVAIMPSALVAAVRQLLKRR